MHILRCDDLDTRRELMVLLSNPKMTPRRRIAFLAECCNQAVAARFGVVSKPDLRKTRGEATEIYWDLARLFVQHGLSVEWATCRLAEIVRRL